MVPYFKPKSLFGVCKGKISIHGDIMSPIDVDWESNKT